MRLLDLEQIEDDIFRGISPEDRWQRVFGGQVAGQALVAAGRTVAPDRLVHSLHSYFIRPGDPSIPIVYEVDRVRDGRSFTMRRVIGRSSTARRSSRCRRRSSSPRTGSTTSRRCRTSRRRSTLPSLGQRCRSRHRRRWPACSAGRGPSTCATSTDPSWAARGAGRGTACTGCGCAPNGALPDDPLLHVCVLTFASDMTLLDSVLVRHGLAVTHDRIEMASLDHAMWFERPFRADEWLLYAMSRRRRPAAAAWPPDGSSPTTAGRSVSVVQEGMIRVG